MFTTKINIPASPVKIDYKSRMLTLGSCFSENIGAKLKDALFDIDINPFGVLFNPESIIQNIGFLAEKKQFTESDIFQNGSLWSSFAHSTLFSDTTPGRCLEKMNTRLIAAAERFCDLDFMMITFGTAWVYRLKDNRQVVANCHKLPSATFERYRLSADEIYNSYSQLLSQLKESNPKLRVLFTVSPVRHWKDGATENNISKGILLQATQELIQNHENALYFPAYEIVVDELRDYRYYAADMLHPSETAVNYIFTEFQNSFFSSETMDIYNRISSYVQAINHRPIHVNTAEYEKFRKNTETKKSELLIEFPFLHNRF